MTDSAFTEAVCCDFNGSDSESDSNEPAPRMNVDEYHCKHKKRHAAEPTSDNLEFSSKNYRAEDECFDEMSARCGTDECESFPGLCVEVQIQRRSSSGDMIEAPALLSRAVPRGRVMRRGSTPNTGLLVLRRAEEDQHDKSFEDILDYDETTQLSSALVLTPSDNHSPFKRPNSHQDTPYLENNYCWTPKANSDDTTDCQCNQYGQCELAKISSDSENEEENSSLPSKTSLRQLNIDAFAEFEGNFDMVRSKTISVDYQQVKRMHVVGVLRRSNTLSDPESLYQQRRQNKSVWVNAFAEDFDEEWDDIYVGRESWIYRLNSPLRHAVSRLRRSLTDRRRGNAHQRVSHAHQRVDHTNERESLKSGERQEEQHRDYFCIFDDVACDLAVAESHDIGKDKDADCTVSPLIPVIVPSDNGEPNSGGSMNNKSVAVTVTRADDGDSDSAQFTVPTDCVLTSSFNEDVTAEEGDSSGDVLPMYCSPHTLQQTIQQRNTAELKQDLRSGVWPLGAPYRRCLWLSLCSRLDSWSASDREQYTETVQQIEGEYALACQFRHKQPSFVHSFYRRYFHLMTSVGVARAERVLAVVHYCHPTITYAPTLYPITALFLHYMNEEETYCCLSALLRSRKVNFLVQTRCEFEIGWLTMITLSRKHAGSAVRHLSRSAAQRETLNNVLADWLAWLFCFLPFRHVVRIVDCYLVEGSKVLYRAALALLLLLHRASVKGSTSCAKQLGTDSLQDVMERFCRGFPHSPAKLLSTMFHVKGFSRSTLRSCHQSIRAKIRDNGGRLTFPERSSDKSVCVDDSAGGFPSVESRDQLIGGSSTIAVRELLKLWDNLPQRYALYSPTLLYTSDEHGFSLKTFYSRVEQHEPTVLLLRTACGAVLGAYCTASWATRNRLQEDGSRFTYFGTGEMFVFTLRPSFRLYPWVVRQRQQQSSEPPQAPAHAEQLFMAGDSSMVAIGGGGGSGHAIWLDENLSRGKSDACLTFANPPLVDGGVFSVACMEAFGFSL